MTCRHQTEKQIEKLVGDASTQFFKFLAARKFGNPRFKKLKFFVCFVCLECFFQVFQVFGRFCCLQVHEPSVSRNFKFLCVLLPGTLKFSSFSACMFQLSCSKLNVEFFKVGTTCIFQFVRRPGFRMDMFQVFGVHCKGNRGIIILCFLGVLEQIVVVARGPLLLGVDGLGVSGC